MFRETDERPPVVVSYMRLAWLIGPTMLLAAGCRTTSGGVAAVDKDRGAVSLYSTSDQRSTLSELAKKSEVVKVEDDLKDALRKNRNDVVQIVALADVQVAQGKLVEAEKNCKRALRLDLKNQAARKVLAEVAMRRGDYDLAAIFLTGIGGETAKDSSILNMLALIELQRGNNSGAMGLLKKAVSVNGNDLAARMNMGVLLLKYRQLGSAAVQFERILKVMPDHPDAKLHLAIIKATRGERQEAETLYGEVLAEDKNSPLALYNLAVLKKSGANYDEALDDLKDYLKTNRGKPSDTDQVFALIDGIQKEKAAKGEVVTDDEIQSMVAQMPAASGDEMLAKAPGTATADAPKVTNDSATATAASGSGDQIAQKKAAPQLKTKAADVEAVIPANDRPPAEELDEVEALESELAH